MTLSQAATKSVTNFWLAVGAGVDFGEGAEDGVGAEDEVDAGGGPLGRAGLAVEAGEGVAAGRDLFPLRAHVEQVDEEVVGQRLGARGEDAVFLAVGVGAEDAQAADEHRHLGRGEGEQLRLVDEQRLGRARCICL